MRKELSEVILPQSLGHLERWLERSGAEFFAGDEITICDLVIFTRMKWLRRGVSALFFSVVVMISNMYVLTRLMLSAIVSWPVLQSKRCSLTGTKGVGLTDPHRSTT